MPKTATMTPVWHADGWDVIGDVHGEHDQLEQMLQALGYDLADQWFHPNRRCAVFLGDLTDRGKYPVQVLRTVMGMVNDGVALCVVGNHDYKLRRALIDRSRMTIHRDLEYTLFQISNQMSDKQIQNVIDFIDSLPPYVVCHAPNDRDELMVCAHAGIDYEQLFYVPNDRVISRCLYGDVIGKHEDGRPIRGEGWREEFEGTSFYCVYGHTTKPEPDEYMNSICIDTGAGKCGPLSAFSWPQKWTTTLEAT